MNVHPITMPKDKARAAFEEYRTAVRQRHDDEDQAIMQFMERSPDVRALRHRVAEQAQQMVRKEGRDMSELLRDVLRLYLAEREWLRQERHQLARVRRNERQKAQAGRTDE